MHLKKALRVGAALVALCAAGVAVRTMVYPFPEHFPGAPVYSSRDAIPSGALERLAGGLRIPTISHERYEDTDFAPFDAFVRHLETAYAPLYRTCETERVNTYGLVIKWKGRNAALPPVLLLSHYDVVPVLDYHPAAGRKEPIVFQPDDPPAPPAQALQETWDYPPFSGAVAQGRVYGRGALDMKGMLFALLEAASGLQKEGYVPERDIWFAFGHDEEVGGRQGAARMAAHFKEQGVRFAAVFDEGGLIAAPGAALDSVRRPLALVGVGEKGLLTIRIKVHGLGGHSSMPPAKSSLVLAAEIIQKLNARQMPARIIPPVAAFFLNIGRETSPFTRMALANQWLLRPILFSILEKNPASNALIRTTTAVTMARGSEAPNVLPSTAEITINFRLLPGDAVEDVLEHAATACAGYDTETEIVAAREASSISPENTPQFMALKEAVEAVYPEAIVTSYLTIGGTDAYKYQDISDAVYRLQPVMLTTFEQRTLHNENEYISIENYGRMIRCFEELMRRL